MASHTSKDLCQRCIQASDVPDLTVDNAVTFGRAKSLLSRYYTSCKEVMFLHLCTDLSVSRITEKKLWTNFDDNFGGAVGNS